MIRKQLDYFEQNRTFILNEHKGKIIVVSPDLQIATFGSLEDGYKFGVSAYGYGNFMLKDCKPDSINMTHHISPTITPEA